MQFPATDLGLRRAFEQLGQPSNTINIEKYAESWRPWRAYGAQHLWANLAAPPYTLPPLPLEM